MKLKKKMAWLLSLVLLLAVTVHGNTLTANAENEEKVNVSLTLSIGLEEGTSAEHYGVEGSLNYNGTRQTTISGDDTWDPVKFEVKMTEAGSSDGMEVSFSIPQEDMNDYSFDLTITNAGKRVVINGGDEGEITSKSYSIGQLADMSTIAILLRGDGNEGGDSEGEVTFNLVWQGTNNEICIYKVTPKEDEVQQIPLSSVICISTGQAYSLSADHEWLTEDQLFDVLSRFDGDFSGYRAWLNSLDEETMHNVTVDPGHIATFVAVIYDDTPAPAAEETTSDTSDTPQTPTSQTPETSQASDTSRTPDTPQAPASQTPETSQTSDTEALQTSQQEEEENSVTVSNEEGATVTVSDTAITVVNSDGVSVTRNLDKTAAVTTTRGAVVVLQVAAKTDGTVSGGITTQNLGAIKVNGTDVSLADASVSIVTVPASQAVSNAVASQVSTSSEFRNRVVMNEWTLDLTMMAGETRVSELSAPVRFTIQAPAGSNTSNDFKIVRVHGSEVTTLSDLDNDPATITFETDKFSSYTVVEVTLVQSPKTGEEKHLAKFLVIMFAVSILGIGGVTIVSRRKRKV